MMMVLCLDINAEDFVFYYAGRFRRDETSENCNQILIYHS